MKTELRKLRNLESMIYDMLSHFEERDLYLHEDGSVGTLDQFPEPYGFFEKHSVRRLLDCDNPEDLGLMILYEMLNGKAPELTALRNSYDIL